MAPTSQPIEVVPPEGLLSTVGPFDLALLAAGFVITAMLAIGFIILLRRMGREPK